MLTWLQPLAVLVVILGGGMAAGARYPAGEPEETALLVALGVVTLPGMVAHAVDAARRSRRLPPGEMSEHQRLLEWTRPSSAPLLKPSVPADVAARLVRWFLAVAACDVALLALLMATPADDDWATLAAFPMLVALAVGCLIILGTLAALGVAALRFAVRAGRSHPFLPRGPLGEGEAVPLSFRALMVAVGVCLLGMATFGIPYAVISFGMDIDLPRGVAGIFALAAYTATVDTAAVAWLWALRVTVAMMLGGLAAVVVLSPIAFWRMVVTPSRTTPAPAADADVAAHDRPRPDGRGEPSA